LFPTKITSLGVSLRSILQGAFPGALVAVLPGQVVEEI
jgi:hypothetical protein